MEVVGVGRFKIPGPQIRKALYLVEDYVINRIELGADHDMSKAVYYDDKGPVLLSPVVNLTQTRQIAMEGYDHIQEKYGLLDPSDEMLKDWITGEITRRIRLQVTFAMSRHRIPRERQSIEVNARRDKFIALVLKESLNPAIRRREDLKLIRDIVRWSYHREQTVTELCSLFSITRRKLYQLRKSFAYLRELRFVIATGGKDEFIGDRQILRWARRHRKDSDAFAKRMGVKPDVCSELLQDIIEQTKNRLLLEKE